MYVHCVHAVPTEARGGHWIPWNWSWAAPCGGWKSNLGPLQELQVLPTTEPSPAPTGLFTSEVNRELRNLSKVTTLKEWQSHTLRSEPSSVCAHDPELKTLPWAQFSTEVQLKRW